MNACRNSPSCSPELPLCGAQTILRILLISENNYKRSCWKPRENIQDVIHKNVSFFTEITGGQRYLLVFRSWTYIRDPTEFSPEDLSPILHLTSIQVLYVTQWIFVPGLRTVLEINYVIQTAFCSWLKCLVTAKANTVKLLGLPIIFLALHCLTNNKIKKKKLTTHLIFSRSSNWWL